MVNKKDETIDKKQNSVDEIRDRIDRLSPDIKVGSNTDFVAILLQGKPPKYYKRFAAWCKNTLDSPYYQDMAEALLTMYATDLLTSNSKFTDEFVKGQANNVLFMGEEMSRLSNVSEFKQ